MSLKVKNLNYAFADKAIISDLSLELRPGCYALLGENGIGKTTLLQMLAGIIQPQSGTIHLSNISISESYYYKKKIAYVPANPAFFPMVTGANYLQLISSVKKSRYDKNALLNSLIKSFNLEKYLETKFQDLSLGSQKKFFLSSIVIGENILLILDEPTLGLDADSIQELCHILNQYRKHAVVIFATHDEGLINTLNPTIIHFKNANSCEVKINYDNKILQFDR